MWWFLVDEIGPRWYIRYGEVDHDAIIKLMFAIFFWPRKVGVKKYMDLLGKH